LRPAVTASADYVIMRVPGRNTVSEFDLLRSHGQSLHISMSRVLPKDAAARRLSLSPVGFDVSCIRTNIDGAMVEFGSDNEFL
jgi:hypothetical protein